MKSIRLPLIVYPAIAAVSLLAFFPAAIYATPDAAEVAGDLKVDAIHFSGDGSVQTTAGSGRTNGGSGNTASGLTSVVGGGTGNNASGDGSVVGGGDSNRASGEGSIVSGGAGNTASGSVSVVSGGIGNTASGQDSVVEGGYINVASGRYSVVSGGIFNQAGGDCSWAGGQRAIVRNAVTAGNSNGDQGTFLWSDSAGPNFYSIRSNEFAVRATGGARFVTAVDGSGNPTRTTVIDGNGNVGIGATAPIGPLNVTSGNVTSGALWAGTANVNGFEVGGTGTDRYVSIKRDGAANTVLHVSKSDAEGGELVAFYINGARVGGISATGTSTSYATTSDARLKENIKPTAFTVDDLMKLDVKDFTFKADTGGTVRTGFLAQELYRVIPQAVTVGGDDPATAPWQVDYGRLTPFLVKTVQELKIRNDALQAENEALKADFAAMKERLAKVEMLLASLER